MSLGSEVLKWNLLRWRQTRVQWKPNSSVCSEFEVRWKRFLCWRSSFGEKTCSTLISQPTETWKAAAKCVSISKRLQFKLYDMCSTAASIDAPWRFRELWDELNAHVALCEAKSTSFKPRINCIMLLASVAIARGTRDIPGNFLKQLHQRRSWNPSILIRDRDD